jgi:large subunit ribosomal protein L24|tara:strand:- start:38 stop:355 length:318 start_codon:yes stop_codon:yes gene_type:complete
MAARIKKSDTVMVIAGKDINKRGEVERVMVNERRALVQGINLVKRHTKTQPGVQQGGIIEKPSPLDMSNLKLVCPHCDEGVKVSFVKLDDGRKVRQCKKCKETID